MHTAALALTISAIVVSCYLWLRALTSDACGNNWEIEHLEDLCTLLIVLVCVLVGWWKPRARAAVAVGTGVAAVFFSSKGVSLLLTCLQCHHVASRRLEDDDAFGGFVHEYPHEADTPRGALGMWGALDLSRYADADPLPPPPPPPPSPHPPPPCSDRTCEQCRTLRGVWPLALCAMAVAVAVLEVGLALMRWVMNRRVAPQYATWSDAEPARTSRPESRAASPRAQRRGSGDRGDTPPIN